MTMTKWKYMQQKKSYQTNKTGGQKAHADNIGIANSGA